MTIRSPSCAPDLCKHTPTKTKITYIFIHLRLGLCIAITQWVNRINFSGSSMAVQTPIRGLRSFCVAAKCLSFKHAASQLYLTPSAISHQIKQLEQQLNKQLFKRQTRAIELTPDGKEFFEKVAPILEQLESTITEFTDSSSTTTISITLPEFFSSELFVPKLSSWSEQHPHINLQLETVKSKSEANKESDLSIILAGTKPSDAIVYELFPISYLPACSPSLYSKLKPLGDKALEQTQLILHQSRPWAWHQWANKNDIDDFDPQGIVQVDSMFSVARAAQKGLGIALIPLPMSQSWFDEGVLLPLFDSPLTTRDKYYLVQHDWHASRPELELFVKWLLSEFTDI